MNSPDLPAPEGPPPKVSIAVLTYNHAGFILDALEGIRQQRVTFALEVVVADDCSSDGTLERLRENVQDWSLPVRILPRTENLGMMRNFVSLLTECRGEYVALVEGDDYWTDPEKLLRQVEFLDAHPEAVLCHHRVSYRRAPGGELVQEFPPEDRREELLSPSLLVHGNFIQTCSVMLRRRFLPKWDASFLVLKAGDLPLFALLGQHGLFGYLDRNMAVYRLHPASAWSSQPYEVRLKRTEELHAYLIEALDAPNRGPWVQRAVRERKQRLVEAQMAGSWHAAAGALWELARLLPYSDAITPGHFLRLVAHTVKVFLLRVRRRWAGGRN